MSKPEDFKFDSRVRDRFLRKRELTSAEVKQHLDELPDLEGEYEVMTDIAQPAVTPARSEMVEEPLVFEGIRRLHALGDAGGSPRPAPPPPPPAPSPPQPAYRDSETRGLAAPLHSALMQSEISGVGAGAVSAALGAMAAEALGASSSFVPPTIEQPPAPEPAAPEAEPITPVTLRSEPTPEGADKDVKAEPPPPASWQTAPDSEDLA